MTATQDVPQNVVMTSQALELLTCFQDEFSELVAEVAESCAKQRAESSGQLAKVIEVTVDDVRCAGRIIAESVRQMVTAGRLSPAVEETLKSMNECVNAVRF